MPGSLQQRDSSDKTASKTASRKQPQRLITCTKKDQPQIQRRSLLHGFPCQGCCQKVILPSALAYDSLTLERNENREIKLSRLGLGPKVYSMVIYHGSQQSKGNLRTLLILGTYTLHDMNDGSVNQNPKIITREFIVDTDFIR
jgi:hypothetical protein